MEIRSRCKAMAISWWSHEKQKGGRKSIMSSIWEGQQIQGQCHQHVQEHWNQLMEQQERARSACSPLQHWWWSVRRIKWRSQRYLPQHSAARMAWAECNNWYFTSHMSDLCSSCHTHREHPVLLTHATSCLGNSCIQNTKTGCKSHLSLKILTTFAACLCFWK